MRISSTTLESFRLRQSDEEFIQQITGEFIRTDKMKFGTAFDEAVQQPFNPIWAEREIISYNGWDISAKPILEMQSRINYDLANFQVKQTKLYNIDGEPITLVAKVDILTGQIIDEIKTRFSTMDYDKYYNSLQWRCYLDIFEVPIIYYHVFEFTPNFEYKQAYEPFYYHAYKNIQQDIETALYDLIAFIYKKQLQNYFKDYNG